MPRDPYRLPLIVDLTPPGWQRRAACVGEDPDLFFPEAKGGRNVTHILTDIRAGEAICADCQVRAQCADFSRGERDGTWAGEFRTSEPHLRRRLKETA